MSLKRKLVALQILLVAVGLVIFGITSYQLYRSSELKRLHQSLTNATPVLASALCRMATNQPACQDGTGQNFTTSPPGGGTKTPPTTTRSRYDRGDEPAFLPYTAGSFAQLRSPSGKVLATLRIPFNSTKNFSAVKECQNTPSSADCPSPRIPATLHPTGSRYTFTVKAKSGTGPFLVQVSAAALAHVRPNAAHPQTSPANGDLLVIAIPMGAENSSLHHLLFIDLTIGGILLLVLIASTLALVTTSLRPLERIAAASRKISAGDLSRRVPEASPNSEVGQLSQALNAMLSRIETAFAERDATENKLRQFLSDASHELRTPLTSIRGYAELFRLHGADPATEGGPSLDATEAMRRIEEHTLRMSAMIEELLLLARLDELGEPQRAPVDLVLLAADACSDASAAFPDHPISFDAPDPITVIGDEVHLRRAISNLVNNAVKHTPADTRVEVSVLRREGFAEVAVRDYGPGLPDGAIDHVFERFWQADTSRATGGSGLGLAIVEGVATEHGGAARVSHAPGGGARFVLRLPVPA